MWFFKSIFILYFISLSHCEDTFKYSCGKVEGENKCAHYDSKTDTVILDESKCDYSLYHCDMQSLTKTNDAECTKGNIVSRIQGLPGDECASDNDCTKAIKLTCIDLVCKKKVETETCNHNADCYKGYFCDLKDQKCKAQLAEGAKCDSEYMCLNNLGCFNGECKKYYSFKTGEEFKYTENFNYACISGLEYIKDDSDNKIGKCFSLKYIDDKGTELADSSPQCNKGDFCTYKADLYQSSVICPETYSKDGTNYCPELSIF